MLELIKYDGYTHEKELLEILTTYAENAIAECVNLFSVDDKRNGRDLVTTTDKRIEQYCTSLISRQFPYDEIIAEETYNSKTDIETGKRYWIIDPLDGTWNYANHIPLFAFQIAFVDNMIPVLSVISIPYGINGKERFYAQKGIGAFCNGVKLGESKRSDIRKTVIALGDLSLWNTESVYSELDFVKKTRPFVGLYRIFGSSAISFAYLAASRVDAYISFFQKPWDVVPGMLIAEECGCTAYQLDGYPFRIGLPDFVMINKTDGLHKIVFPDLSHRH